MTKPTQSLSVDLAERAYEIRIGSGNLAEISAFMASHSAGTHALVITDRNVEFPHAETVANSLAGAGWRVNRLVLEPGEATKSAGQASRLWLEMLEAGTDRKSVVVAVGGGVIGDLAGFVAATFARGIRLVQVPTTLLAQVDSSVGGKVGINLPTAKNMVGAFWQPHGVLIDTRVLQTLPDREFRSGLAEVVKYGVILDPQFFGYLEQHVDPILDRDAEVLQRVIWECCRLKAEVVTADEREETGLRAVLNYGHTFCHAFESVTRYGAYLHGEAVAIGMLCASRLANSMQRIDDSVTQRQQQLLMAFGLPTDVPDLDRQQLLAAMRTDKKSEHGRLRFVLPTRLGHVELVDGISDQDVLNAMR